MGGFPPCDAGPGARHDLGRTALTTPASLSSLPLLTLADAPEPSRALLESAQQQLGFVPLMYGGMANVPGLLSTYQHGYQAFRRDGSFTATEQEVVMLAISAFHECTYCVAAHSTVADLTKVPAEVTDALREGKPLDDPRLQALRELTTELLATRGRPEPEAMQAFLAAGYTEQQVLEVLLAIAVKTISNYTNHLLGTPLDAVFAARAWTPPSS